MMDRERTKRGYNGHTRGNSLMYVVLLMTLLTVLSSRYVAIPQYSMKAALNSRRYMEAQLSSKTVHHSFCETASSEESPAMDLVWQGFQEDCNRLGEEFDEMIDEEEAEKGEDEELKAETSSLEEGIDTEEDVATEEDTAAEEDMAVEEETRWEWHLYHALGSKEYVVHGKGVSGDSGIIGDGAAEASTADSLITIGTALTAQPLESLTTVHTWVVSSGYSSFLMANIVSDDRDRSAMVIRKPYRSSGGGGPEVRAYLNGNGVRRYYEGS